MYSSHKFTIPHIVENHSLDVQSAANSWRIEKSSRFIRNKENTTIRPRDYSTCRKESRVHLRIVHEGGDVTEAPVGKAADQQFCSFCDPSDTAGSIDSQVRIHSRRYQYANQ